MPEDTVECAQHWRWHYTEHHWPTGVISQLKLCTPLIQYHFFCHSINRYAWNKSVCWKSMNFQHASTCVSHFKIQYLWISHFQAYLHCVKQACMSKTIENFHQVQFLLYNFFKCVCHIKDLLCLIEQWPVHKIFNRLWPQINLLRWWMYKILFMGFVLPYFFNFI